MRAKAISLPIYYIVFNRCVYTRVTAAAAKIKGKNRFRVRFRSSINAPLHLCSTYQFRTVQLDWKSEASSGEP